MFEALSKRRGGALALAGIALLAVPAYAAAPSGVIALAKLQKGKWQVRELDGAVPGAAICLGNPEQLVRFAHRTAPGCTQEIFHNGAASATVQYTCGARGFGHSAVRVETPRSVRIDSQGFTDGHPFSFKLEARRVGAC